MRLGRGRRRLEVVHTSGADGVPCEFRVDMRCFCFALAAVGLPIVR